MTTRQRIRRAAILVSFLLFPITLDYFSPYLIINGAAQGIVAGSALTFGGLFVGSLALGRAWCGWLCPGAGIQELCFAVNNRRVRGGRLNWIKYGIWAPWIAAIVMAAVAGGGLRRIDPLHLIENGISVSEPGNYLMYFTVVGLVVVLAFVVGRRAFCHYVCWIAPFMVIGTALKSRFKWPSLHIEATTSECKQCKTCTSDCPMSLEVNEMVLNGSMDDTECVLCGTCVNNCPHRVLRYAWKRTKAADS